MGYGYGADRNYVEGVVYFDVWWDAWLIKTDANGNEQWNKTFGAAGNDQVHSVQQTSEGGYILAGKTSSYGAGRWDFWLIKVGNKDVGIAPSKDTAPTINKSPDKVVFDGLSVQWSKTFGTQYKHDWAESVQQTSDGGYILAGRTGAKSASRSDVLIIKADANGNEQWNSTYGGREHDSAHSVKQTSDGGYIIAGFTNSFGDGNSDVWLFKVDPNGNPQWSKTFGGTKSDGAFTVQLTSDGDYLVAGCTNSYGAASDDVLLLKTDLNGNKQWNRTFGGTGTDIAYSVQQTSDKGYILTGFTFSYGAGSNDFWLIKTDANGNLEWNKTFWGTGDDRAYSIQQTSDGGYILVGCTGSYGTGRSGAWLIKTNKQGNEQWNKPFEGGSAESVKQTSDGGYILAGNVNKDAWLIKTDEIGNEQWNKTFGGTKPGTVFGIHSAASSVQQTSDGGYILAGTTNLYGPGDDDVWLIKIGAEPPTPTPTPTPPRRGGGDGVSDSDGDGYSDIEELIVGTDPYDPCDPKPSSAACIGGAIIAEVITTPKPTPYEPTKDVTPPTTKPKATIPPLEEPEEPEKEPGVPGFEAVSAIAGLLAVAYILRRMK